MQSKLRACFLILTLAGALGCSSTTEEGQVGVNRRQFLLVPAEQVNSMSEQGYDQMKAEAQQKKTLDQNAAQVKRVQSIVQRLVSTTTAFRKDANGWPWEAHVITSNELNAFCMPGGKIMVYTGLMDQLKLTDAELAAVLGHEIAHALREHGRERISEQMVTQGGLQVLMATGKLDPKYAQAAGTVSALLISMPYGRKQESEADEIGLELMARAGFDPAESLTLWQKMGAAGGAKPPELLSTHPSDSRRLADLRELQPKVRPLYEAAVRKL